jgi:hypothetical protein
MSLLLIWAVASRQPPDTTFCGRDNPANLGLETRHAIAYIFAIANGSRRPGQPSKSAAYAVGPRMTSKRIPRKRTSLRKGPVWTICKHENRVLIEQTRIAGASLDSIALKFGCSRDAVHRHMANHVPQDLLAQYLADAPIKELAQKAAAEGMSVLQYLSLIRSTLMNEFQLAAAVHDRHATSALAGRLNEVLRSIGSISGELGDMARSITVNGNVINMMNHPQLANLQANLLRALAPFPEARNAVIAALKAMDAPVDELAASSASPPDSMKMLELQAVNAV